MKKTCLHCNFEWISRLEDGKEPRACPRCKSPRWNEPLRKPGRAKSQKGRDDKK